MASNWKSRAIPFAANKEDQLQVLQSLDPNMFHKPTRLESATRGAGQGLSFGFEDEARAGIMAPFSEKDYGTIRDEIRAKNERAESAHPVVSGVSEIAAGILPAVAGTIASGGSAAPATLKGVAAASGAYGLGKSKADLTEGEFGKAAMDTGQGVGLGYLGGKYVAPALGKAVVKGQDLVRKGLSKLGKEGAATGLAVGLNVPRQAVKERIARPGAIQSAQPWDEQAEKLVKDVLEVDDQISKYADDMFEAIVDRPTIRTSRPLQYIRQLQNELQAGGVDFGDATKTAHDKLQNYYDDISEYAAKYKWGDTPYIFGRDLKKMLRSLDADVDWDSQNPEFVTKQLKQLRRKMDEILKEEFPELGDIMQQISKRVGLVQNIKKSFGLRNVTGEGLRPTDRTAGKIKGILDHKKITSRGDMRKLKALTKDDIIQAAEDYKVKEQFLPGENIRGSRMTGMYGAMGAGVGGSIAGGPGAFVGAGMGAAFGAGVDVKGREVAGNLIDWAMKKSPEKILEMMTLHPSMFGAYRDVVEKALRRGTSSFAATHFVLQQNDPNYRKMTEEMTMGGQEENQ